MGNISRIKIYLEADVALELALEPVADLARRDEFSFPSGKGRAVDEEIERNGGLVDSDRRKRDRLGICRNSLAHEDVRQTRDRDDIPCGYFLRLCLLQPLEGKHLRYFPAARLARRLLHENRLAHFECTFVHARDGKATQEIIVAEVERLKPRGDTFACKR